jgi:hypothetical protein
LLAVLFYRQRLLDERIARKRAPEHIYWAVRRTLDQALIKTGGNTIEAGRTVADALELHLGPVLAFGGVLGKPLGKLKTALNGQIKADRHEHAKPDHARFSEQTAQPAIVVSSNSENVVIAPAQIVTMTDADHGAGHHEFGEHRLEMTAREQIVAVREALEHLSEYWRRDVVERELCKIQDLFIIQAPLGLRPAPALGPTRRRQALSTVRINVKPN